MKWFRRFILSLGAFCILLSVFALLEHTSLLQFRTSDSDYKWWSFSRPDRTGLKGLNISGSGVIHEKAIRNSLGSLNVPVGKLYIINLTVTDQLYADGRPFRWFNWHKTDTGIAAPYRAIKNISRLTNNYKWFLRRHWYPSPQDSHIENEEEMVKRLGYHYLSFHVDKRKVFPPDTVDKFIDFVDQLPKDAWVHFHCDGGNSRTTTMMIFHDILKNGKTVPLQTIISRQYALGGVDINDTTAHLGGTWKFQNLVMRKTLVEDFYRYVNDPNGYGATKWSQWFAVNGKAQTPKAPEPLESS